MPVSPLDCGFLILALTFIETILSWTLKISQTQWRDSPIQLSTMLHHILRLLRQNALCWNPIRQSLTWCWSNRNSVPFLSRWNFYRHLLCGYNYNKFLFNLAYRKESSNNMKEDNGMLTYERNKIDYYGGIQRIWNSHITTGVAYNNFLVKDISFTLTLFLWLIRIKVWEKF